MQSSFLDHFQDEIPNNINPSSINSNDLVPPQAVIDGPIKGPLFFRPPDHMNFPPDQIPPQQSQRQQVSYSFRNVDQPQMNIQESPLIAVENVDQNQFLDLPEPPSHHNDLSQFQDSQKQIESNRECHPQPPLQMQRQGSSHGQPKQGQQSHERPPLHRHHRGRKNYSPEQKQERAESLPKYSKFGEELDKVIQQNPTLYEHQCTLLLNRFQKENPGLDKKTLQKIYYSKILDQEMVEHQKQKKQVRDKFWLSPKKQSVAIDPQLIKKLEEKSKPAQLVYEKGFLSKFSNNDNLAAHKQRVVAEQKLALLKQMEEKRLRKEMRQQEIDLEEARFNSIVEKPYPIVSARDLQQRTAKKMDDFADDQGLGPQFGDQDFQPKGREIFRSQITFGNRAVGDTNQIQQKQGSGRYFLKNNMTTNQSYQQESQHIQQVLNQQNESQFYPQIGGGMHPQMQNMQTPMFPPQYNPEQFLQYQEHQRRLMEERAKSDHDLLQNQAKSFMTMLQSLVQETVSASQVQHSQLQSLLNIAPTPANQGGNQTVGIRLPNSMLPAVQQLHQQQQNQQMNLSRSQTSLGKVGNEIVQGQTTFGKQQSASLAKSMSGQLPPLFPKQDSSRISRQNIEDERPLNIGQPKDPSLSQEQPLPSNSLVNQSLSHQNSHLLSQTIQQQKVPTDHQSQQPSQHQQPHRQTFNEQQSLNLDKRSSHSYQEIPSENLQPKVEMTNPFNQSIISRHSSRKNLNQVELSGQSFRNTLTPQMQAEQNFQRQQSIKQPTRQQSEMIPNHQVINSQRVSDGQLENQQSIQNQPDAQKTAPVNFNYQDDAPIEAHQNQFTNSIVSQPLPTQQQIGSLQSDKQSNQQQSKHQENFDDMPIAMRNSQLNQPSETQVKTPPNAQTSLQNIIQEKQDLKPNTPSDKPLTTNLLRKESNNQLTFDQHKSNSKANSSDQQMQPPTIELPPNSSKTSNQPQTAAEKEMNKRMMEIEQSILSAAERNEIQKMAKKQEEETKKLMDEIQRLHQERQSLKLNREVEFRDDEIDDQQNQLQQQKEKFDQEREQLMQELRQTEKEKEVAEEKFRAEKAKFRYSEPPTDRNARSFVEPDYITGQDIYQQHDLSFQANTDDLNFQPVKLPTAAFIDPDAQVFQPDQSMAQGNWADNMEQKEEQNSQVIDFDRIMHENFQYENTMNKAHLNRFTRHTGELMFSRAGMRHLFLEKKKQEQEFQFKAQYNEFNLAREGVAQIDQQPKLNRVFEDGFVNLGTDQQDEAYQTYLHQQLAYETNLGEVQPWNQLDAAGLEARVVLEQQDKLLVGGYQDYTKGKEIHEFHNQFQGEVNLCDGVGSQHSSFIHEENQRLRQKLGHNFEDVEQQMRLMRCHRIQGIMYKPEDGGNPYVPMAFQPVSKANLQLRPGEPVPVVNENRGQGPSRFISQAIKQGIEDFRTYPTMEFRKEELINQMYEEARKQLELQPSSQGQPSYAEEEYQLDEAEQEKRQKTDFDILDQVNPFKSQKQDENKPSNKFFQPRDLQNDSLDSKYDPAKYNYARSYHEPPKTHPRRLSEMGEPSIINLVQGSTPPKLIEKEQSPPKIQLQKSLDEQISEIQISKEDSKSPIHKQKENESMVELARQLTEGKERLIKENNVDKSVLPIMKIKQIREKREARKQKEKDKQLQQEQRLQKQEQQRGILERVKSAVSNASSKVSSKLRRSLSMGFT